jgi:hypothetical protein
MLHKKRRGSTIFFIDYATKKIASSTAVERIPIRSSARGKALWVMASHQRAQHASEHTR